MSVDPKWFKEELWRLIDAAQILNGVEPLRGARDADDPNCVYELIPDLEVRADVWDVYNQAKYSRHNGTLKHRGSPTGREGNYLIPVLDFLDWAESKGYSLEHIPQGVFHVADEYLETSLGYTINGVAKQIASRYSVPANAMRDQLRVAVEAGKLKLVSPETRMPYTNPPSVIRNFYDRIRSADIDKWFADNEAPYRLRQQEDEVVPSRPSSVPRNRIINGFPVSPRESDNRKFWDDKLSRPPKWLIGARVSVGKPGISSQWNPALVAHALLGKGYMSLKALDAAMQNFPDWLDEWKEGTELNRQ